MQTLGLVCHQSRRPPPLEKPLVSGNSRASISRGFVPSGNHPSDFGLLLRREFRLASADAPFPTGRIQTRLRPLPQHGPFKFGKCPDHLHHHSSRRSGRVDRFGQTAELAEVERQIAQAERETRRGAEQPPPDRLQGVARDIWEARQRSDSQQAFIAALQERGIKLAEATGADVQKQAAEIEAKREFGSSHSKRARSLPLPSAARFTGLRSGRPASQHGIFLDGSERVSRIIWPSPATRLARAYGG